MITVIRNRSIECCILGGWALVCLGASGCSDQSRASVPTPQGAASAGLVAPAVPAVEARFVTVPEVFSQLERPPVRFDHDKHTVALEPQGCDVCHRADARGDFSFTYAIAEGPAGKTAAMNAFHDDCIGCHTRRTREGEKAGPVTCGECHVADRMRCRHEYSPVMPDYYQVLRDTYHSECVSCHREPAKAAHGAVALDWKSFYVKQAKTEAHWPKVAFDYLRHAKHEKALENKCDLCHTLSPERQEELKAKGREPAGRDWVWDVDEKNSLTERVTAHARCINCHLQRAARKAPGGPVQCNGCHSAVSRTVKELADVARPKCDQEDLMLMRLEKGARAKAVAFNHQSHVAASRSCQECHHKTLRPCEDCHTVGGSKEGNWITLAEAHHKVSSSLSCVGCHEAEKSKADCAGCHQFMPRGLSQAACSGCHTGSLDRLRSRGKLAAAKDLIPQDVADKLEVKRIEDEYKPAKLPHLAMAQRLTDISNQSALASYFHTEPMTVCAGCHHLGPLEARSQVASCATCHTARHEPGPGTPTLLGAYHQRCLGCHKQMAPTGHNMPQTCTGCHEENAGGAKHLAARSER